MVCRAGSSQCDPETVCTDVRRDGIYDPCPIYVQSGGTQTAFGEFLHGCGDGVGDVGESISGHDLVTWRWKANKEKEGLLKGTGVYLAEKDKDDWHDVHRVAFPLPCTPMALAFVAGDAERRTMVSKMASCNAISACQFKGKVACGSQDNKA